MVSLKTVYLLSFSGAVFFHSLVILASVPSEVKADCIRLGVLSLYQLEKRKLSLAAEKVAAQERGSPLMLYFSPSTLYFRPYVLFSSYH